MTLGSCLSHWTVCGPAIACGSGDNGVGRDLFLIRRAGSYAGLGAESTIDWVENLRRKIFCTVL